MPDVPAAELPSFGHLVGLMERYTVRDLVDVDAVEFRQVIDDFLDEDDYGVEGFESAEGQRDLTIRFHWGHNHDFGDFSVDGRMADRHLEIPSVFIDEFGVLPLSLEGKRVLDIGCWTGGTSLLLCAMGAEVVAIEEVQKYVNCLSYLKESFALDALEVLAVSLYDCAEDEAFQDTFDYVLYSGVLYHVTDPVLSLRMVFNALKDGGTCLVETMAHDSPDQVLAYQGPTWFPRGANVPGSRGGWNWLVPSPPALVQMLSDVGFRDVRSTGMRNGRALAVGRRQEYVPIMRSGLSRRSVR
jgi:2-polyprenyl-3-methyl-5-hydroxy-6-metoxy-1,4-benzoquinol methylase